MLVATKTRHLFATQLLKELNGDLVHFTTCKGNLPGNKPYCCKLRKVVGESREKFCFMQQNLYTFLVLSAQGRLVLQQVGDATSGQHKTPA